jgi:hypothetical protein
MSEALPPDPAPEAPVDPDVAMLARLAAVGMAAVERVHGELMAAEDTKELNALSLTQSRLSRCVRLTLLLKSKLAREAEQAAQREPPRERDKPKPVDPREAARSGRIDDLEDAMARIAHAVGEGSDEEIEILNDRIEVEIADWVERYDFGEADIDAQVRWLCGQLDFPAHLADGWQDLEHPDEREPPWGWPKTEAEEPEEAATPPPTDPPHGAPDHESSA